MDRQRLTLCRRALPALATADADPRLLHVGPGSVPRSVRVDYAEGKRQHRIDCLFDEGAGLTAILSDQKPINGATLYLLKRYYLDTHDAVENDPVLATEGHRP